ncbi:hypothetical protein BDV95DRAFT_595627 [Massariosphaeria phaeospora]|uniref:Uncharacterized protein n=1 Tax=Massariosphaeria phaeospora TaxID=100035 RepID=A0A7C8M6C1_9PLEO|nr:hypothetical protein BDV95DRAFT_595627 [Massariosphaeria phaeospora]
MSKKRKPDEVSVTEEDPITQKSRSDAKTLLKSARENKDFVLLVDNGSKWTLPQALLSLESKLIKRKIASGSSEHYTNRHLASAVELWVQWLHTRSYHEEDFIVPDISLYSGSLAPHTPDPTPDDLDIGIIYPIKAALVAWHLGDRLESPRFQNYAMTRLSHALNHKLPTPQASARILYHLSFLGSHWMPLRFFEDFLLRNWGDWTVIERGDAQDWADLLRRNDRFRLGFVHASIWSLEHRRAIEMKAEQYFVDEEGERPPSILDFI